MPDDSVCDPSVQSSRCDGAVIEYCVPEGSCGTWEAVSDCATNEFTCDDSQGEAVCMPDCGLTGPAMPSTPLPDDATTDIDSTMLSLLDWDDVPGAIGYHVYLGDTCPPPAYPDPAYQWVDELSELTGIMTEEVVSYCWRVVPEDNYGCWTPGPEWTFDTACIDHEPGRSPTVTSRTAIFGQGATSGVYRLTFSEPVFHVAENITLTPSGSETGTLGSVVALDAQTYEVGIEGLADGDEYTLTVATGVTDTCGNAMAGPANIRLATNCALVTGDYAVDLHDSYGDGWQTTTSGGGPGITATLDDGTVFEFGLCTPYQASGFACIDEDHNGSTTVSIPPTATSVDWYFPGDFWGEISFEIYLPGGGLAASATAGTPAGPIAVNYCGWM